MNDWQHDLEEFIHEQFEAYKTGQKEQHEAVEEIAHMVKLIVGGREYRHPVDPELARVREPNAIGSVPAARPLPPPLPPRGKPPGWPTPMAEDENLGALS